MIDNYIEAPEFIIEMLKREYSTEDGNIALNRLSDDTDIEAYETVWDENRVYFDTYDGVPVSVFAVLCERYPQEQMKYYFYSHSMMGNSMVLLNEDGVPAADPKYEEMMEAEERMMREIDEDYAEYDDKDGEETE